MNESDNPDLPILQLLETRLAAQLRPHLEPIIAEEVRSIQERRASSNAGSMSRTVEYESRQVVKAWLAVLLDAAQRNHNEVPFIGDHMLPEEFALQLHGHSTQEDVLLALEAFENEIKKDSVLPPHATAWLVLHGVHCHNLF